MDELTKTNSCANCNSNLLKEHGSYQIKCGEKRKIYKCTDCQEYFSETRGTIKAGLHTQLSRIILILSSIAEGMGINAACRVFKVSKKSIYSWQERFSNLKRVLLIYSLCHEFIEQIVEGDEIYTKVKKTSNLANQQDGQ